MYNIAISGATGNVGKELIEILVERNFPVNKVHLLASERSAGMEMEFGDKVVVVEDLSKFDFNGIDFVFSSPGGEISKIYSPIAAKAGAIVIDNTSVFRMDKDIPLVVPEVNPEALKDFANKNIIANPNCSTIQMLVALAPLHKVAKIKRVVVSTYQATSGGGKEAMDELFTQTRGIYANENVENKVFTKQIAFNAIPHIDVFMDSGYTKEEWKMNVETKKMLDENIEVSATAVRIPTFIGHAEAITVEFDEDINEKQFRDALSSAEGLAVVDHRANEGYVTPVECAGEDKVYVSRIRKDISKDNSFCFWCVADNVRKGAALNTVQIAEKMIEMNLK